jgi:hypothetical protein
MMLLGYVWFLSLAILGSAQEPWEINRSPSALEQDPNGVPDTRAATYFIDDSCLNEDEEDPDQMDVDENEPDFRDVMAEVQNMAREGFNRLKENLGDFRTGYIKIMKVSPENDIELKEQIVMSKI